MPIKFDVQGILYLNDVAENQGAFRCIPGFHRKIESWLSGLPADANPREENLEDAGVVSLCALYTLWRATGNRGTGTPRPTR